MTKKDFEKIAEAIKTARPDTGGSGPHLARLGAWADTAYAVENVFVKDNPRFDKEKFRKACGLL